MASSTIRINITPQTQIRTTQGDKIYFRIPRAQLRPAGLKRLLRIERYNKYKIDLLALCRSKGFTIPPQGLCVRFFIPVPPSWSLKKKKLHHGMLHQGTPDLDNLLKAVFDSLCSQDKYIGHLGELSKQWVHMDKGWIEFEEKDMVLKKIATHNEQQLA